MLLAATALALGAAACGSDQEDEAREVRKQADEAGKSLEKEAEQLRDAVREGDRDDIAKQRRELEEEARNQREELEDKAKELEKESRDLVP